MLSVAIPVNKANNDITNKQSIDKHNRSVSCVHILVILTSHCSYVLLECIQMYICYVWHVDKIDPIAVDSW